MEGLVYSVWLKWWLYSQKGKRDVLVYRREAATSPVPLDRRRGTEPGSVRRRQLWKQKASLGFGIPFEHTHTHPTRERERLCFSEARTRRQDTRGGFLSLGWSMSVVFIWWNFTFFYVSMKQRQCERKKDTRHAVCYTTYAVVPFCMLCKRKSIEQSKRWCMYMRKLIVRYHSKYILLYILVSFTFSSLLIRGCELYSFQLVTHIREEIKRVLGQNRRENICELQLSKKTNKKNSLAGLICEA